MAGDRKQNVGFVWSVDSVVSSRSTSQELMLGKNLVLEVSFERISAVTSQAGIVFLLSGPVVIFSDMTSRIMAS